MDKNNKVKESRGESRGRERGSFSLRSSSVYVKIKINRCFTKYIIFLAPLHNYIKSFLRALDEPITKGLLEVGGYYL